jgi:hypothetical protein
MIASAAAAFTGRLKYQVPVPVFVVVPISNFTLTNTVFPICLYLPVKVPLFNTGWVPSEVHDGE